MKLKQLILIGAMLPCIAYLQASSVTTTPSVTDINSAISQLAAAQSALALLLGITVVNNSTSSTVQPTTSTNIPAIPTDSSASTDTTSSASDTITDSNAPAQSASTVFYNDAGQTISVQALINGQNSGTPVVITYTPTAPYNSSTVTITGNTDMSTQVSYNVTLPNSPDYIPVTVPYNAQFTGGYQVNASSTDILVTGLTQPYNINNLSTTFYNTAGQPLQVQPLLNGNPTGTPVVIAYTDEAPTMSGVVTAAVMADQKLSYSISMPQSPNYTPVTVSYNGTDYPTGYQVIIDGNNIVVGGLPAVDSSDMQATLDSNVHTDISSEQTTTMITNNATQTAYLIMLDEDGDQVNPTPIALQAGKFSYVPSNVTAMQIVDAKNSNLVAATAMNLNEMYALHNTNNVWSITIQQKPTAYTYKNATTLPVVIAITTGNIISSQQIAAGATYSQVIDPLATISLDVHANLPALCQSYNPALSYSLTVDAQNNILALTTTSGQDKKLTNNSGWQVLVDAVALDTTHDYLIIENGQQYTPQNECARVTIIPLINNSSSSSGAPASCSIISQAGNLHLQF